MASYYKYIEASLSSFCTHIVYSWASTEQKRILAFHSIILIMAPLYPLFISMQVLLVFIFVLHALTITSATFHRWVGPVGHRVITVDVNGGGHFRSVQAAVDAVPDNNRMNVQIQISPGYYM